MREVAEKVMNGLEQELGPNWRVTPVNIFDCVYYFKCCTFNQKEFECNTHSYGMYTQTDVDKIIKTESERIRTQYRQMQQVLGVTS